MNLLKDVLLDGKLSRPLRTWIGYLCYYVLPILSFVLVYFGGIETAIELGNPAIAVFFVVLLGSPLADLIPQIKFFRLIKSLRRELGVLSFWLVMAHGLGIMYFVGLFDLSALAEVMHPGSLYFWGIIGALGMLYLGITSNMWATKLLKRFWKKSHIIVIYPVMIASIIHVIMAGEGGWTFLAVVYGVLKVWAMRNNRQKTAKKKVA